LIGSCFQPAHALRAQPEGRVIKFSHPLIKPVLGCLAFTILGFYLLNSETVFHKIVGSLTVLFFGLGGLGLLWSHGQKSTPGTTQSTSIGDPVFYLNIESVSVAQVDIDDDEVLEFWKRSCAGIANWMQDVSVQKSDHDIWCWSVTVGAGEFVRQPSDNALLHDAIVRAVMKVPGTRDVAREDNEVWLVSGNISGDALVRYTSVGLDSFLSDRGFTQSWPP